MTLKNNFFSFNSEISNAVIILGSLGETVKFFPSTGIYRAIVQDLCCPSPVMALLVGNVFLCGQFLCCMVMHCKGRERIIENYIPVM